MFPRPMEQAARAAPRMIYQVMLPISLLVWLLPLLAIFMTSIRSAKDITTGNAASAGLPGFEMVDNYTGVFMNSNAGQHFPNFQSGSRCQPLRCHHYAGMSGGLCSGDLPVPLVSASVLCVHCWQFRAVPDFGWCRCVTFQCTDWPVRYGDRTGAVPCCLSDWFLYPFHAEFHSGPAV